MPIISEVESVVARAKEICNDLRKEYEKCLVDQVVSDRARNLTHDVVEKLCNALDQLMYLAWAKRIKPNLPQDKQHPRGYFPAAKDLASLHSTLGQWYVADLDMKDPLFYSEIEAVQPFKGNNLLLVLRDISRHKHIGLLPQIRREKRWISVIGSGGAVRYDPSAVRFGHGVSILGAPVDPSTQRITQTPNIRETTEVWVAFLLPDYNIDAMAFCERAIQQVIQIVVRWRSVLHLS